MAGILRRRLSEGPHVEWTRPIGSDRPLRLQTSRLFTPVDHVRSRPLLSLILPPPVDEIFWGISVFFCVCGFSRLAPEVYPRWGPGLSRCLCCVAIANKTPASLQTVYCSVPVRTSVRVRVCVCLGKPR